MYLMSLNVDRESELYNVLNEKREILEKVYEEQAKNDNWEEEFDDKIVSLAETITIDDIERKIVSLNEDITNIDLWRKLINNDILPKNNTEMQDIKTNLYYETGRRGSKRLL